MTEQEQIITRNTDTNIMDMRHICTALITMDVGTNARNHDDEHDSSSDDDYSNEDNSEDPDNQIATDPNDQSFHAWLTRQNARDDPVGDLARDFCQDLQQARLLPLRISSPTTMVTYFTSRGACDDAILAARNAGLEWCSK